MDWTAAKVALDGAAVLISIGVGVYAWWANRNRARRTEIAELRETDQHLQVQISANIARMDALEKDLSRQPGHGDIETLRKTVTDLSGHVQKLNGSMDTMGRFLDMMNSHLLGGHRD